MKLRQFKKPAVIAAALVFLTSFAIPHPRYIVRGCYDGEPFFRGLPASYWADRVAEHDKRLQPSAQAPRFLGIETRFWPAPIASVVAQSMVVGLIEPPTVLDPEHGAIDVLLVLMRDPREWVRFHACCTLRQMRPFPTQAIEPFVSALEWETSKLVCFIIAEGSANDSFENGSESIQRAICRAALRNLNPESEAPLVAKLIFPDLTCGDEY